MKNTNGYEELKQMFEKVEQYGINRYIMPDEMDVEWLKMDVDDREGWEHILDNILRPKGKMRVLGMRSTIHIQKLQDEYQVVLSHGGHIVSKPKNIYTEDDLLTYLLLEMQGYDNIYDFGEYD